MTLNSLATGKSVHNLILICDKSDSGLNWNLEMLVVEEGGKTRGHGEKTSEQGEGPTTNSPQGDIETGNQTWAT